MQIVPFTLEPNLILSVLLPSPVNLLLPLAPCPLEQVSLCRQLLVMTAFKKSRKVLFANLEEWFSFWLFGSQYYGNEGTG